MNCIAITGASGYIGKNLVVGLVNRGGYRIKLLNHTKVVERLQDAAVEIIEGDLLLPESLSGFLERGCTVINLVYLWDAGESANLVAMNNLLVACRAAGVKRLIHVSTAAVVGRVNDNVVCEATPCQPISEYGITKLSVENLLLRDKSRNFDLVILRPTSVYGLDAAPLRKLASELKGGSRLLNYLKSCLFRGRRMNLVHIDNVVEAITFLVNQPEDFHGDIFIVSDDDSCANNFTDVELVLMRGLGVPVYRLPLLPIPLIVLKFILSVLGRSNVNPKCNYSSDKLLSRGFRRQVNFEVGLSQYVSAYRLTCSSKAPSDARS